MKKKCRPDVEYMARLDAERLSKLAHDLKEKLSLEELNELKKLHEGHCASCGFELHPTPFKGVFVHRCYNCGGVFLEKGVLEILCGEEPGIFDKFLDIFKF